MKVILIGYPGSEKIVPASKYLTSKYLPGFDITYLNYKGPIDGWGDYVAGFLKYLTDENVIFALDDYLVSGGIDMYMFNRAVSDFKWHLCTKLCQAREDENKEYPITTQYSLWDRLYLIKLLTRFKNPWDFEIHGSLYFKEEEKNSYPERFSHKFCIPYFTNSSLSGRWEGVNLSGLKEEDINYMKENGLL